MQVEVGSVVECPEAVVEGVGEGFGVGHFGVDRGGRVGGAGGEGDDRGHPAAGAEQVADAELEPVAVGRVDFEPGGVERAQIVAVRVGAEVEQQPVVVVVGLGVERDGVGRSTGWREADGLDRRVADDPAVEFESAPRFALGHEVAFDLEAVVAALHGPAIMVVMCLEVTSCAAGRISPGCVPRSCRRRDNGRRHPGRSFERRGSAEDSGRR